MSAPARSAVEMPENIAALLPKVRRKPVPLSRNGKTAAVLVSARDYQKMAEIAEEMAEEEDRYWLRQVAKARAENKKNPPKESDVVRAKRFRKLLDEILAS